MSEQFSQEIIARDAVAGFPSRRDGRSSEVRRPMATSLAHTALFERHQSLGATFEAYAGWELPKFYTSIEEEYAAARERVAVVDRSHVSKMKVTGRDRLDLLHRLTTQYFFYKNKDARQPFNDPSEDPDALKAGEGREAALITAKGRIIDYLLVYGFEDSLLVLFSSRNRERVPQWIDGFVFREDFQMTDVTAQQAMLLLLGPQASTTVETLAGQSVASLPMHHFITPTIGGAPVIVARTWNLGSIGAVRPCPSFHLITPVENAVNLWDVLIERGVQPVGEDVYEVLRIEAGLPVVGKELSEEVNPWEARLDAAIHLAKGCYTGQEVIARIQTYQKVHKRLLAGIRLIEARLPEPGSKVTAAGRDVGFITSAARSPALGNIALAYVHGEYDDPGVRVTVHTPSGDVEGIVASLPFVAASGETPHPQSHDLTSST
ncbi:MAG: aminomethyltransferase family protein [Abditibacteriales bacterium]|nr:aminomethyltransferase family protein [Abditibacteriales bacterium]MDW8366490.1 aminomethyltransferase family protein [Abditibacteriales bacterium]